MYNELVETCFFAPNHVGTVDLSLALSVYYRKGEAGRGDVCDFYLLCNEQGFIVKARFKAYGNPYLIAAAEWLCQQLEGSQIDEHPHLIYSLLVQELALPKNRYAVALQLEDGYRELVLRMQMKLTPRGKHEKRTLHQQPLSRPTGTLSPFPGRGEK